MVRAVRHVGLRAHLVDEVIKTLAEAMVLVFLVMLLFLQNLRATLIPTLVIPVALLGTFLGMYVLGFTINQLSLFGMVLAIGIVVDDAIVVIENVERIMTEEGLSPKEATRKAMHQITGAVIAITWCWRRCSCRARCRRAARARCTSSSR
jgi:multidrug efflux pump